LANNGLEKMNEKTNREQFQFIGITYGFSWLLWLPQVLKFNGFPNLPDIVGLPGMFAPFGPAVAAFWLTWRQSGKVGAKKLWLRGWQVNFSKKWLLPALLLGPITGLLAVACVYATEGNIFWEYGVPIFMIVPVFFLIYFTNALPEEYGWRGYALDRLQKSNNALKASLVLGLIWALWHLPLFFIEGTTQAAIPMYQFFLQTLVLSIFYTWLHNNTAGSVLIAGLFHAVSNTAAAVIPFWVSNFGRWIDFGILVVMATIVIWRWGWKKLSMEHGLKISETA
jgi:membrane protease YdiL (CAAX protease family)